jgi:hypothetical protein
MHGNKITIKKPDKNGHLWPVSQIPSFVSLLRRDRGPFMGGEVPKEKTGQKRTLVNSLTK